MSTKFTHRINCNIVTLDCCALYKYPDLHLHLHRPQRICWHKTGATNTHKLTDTTVTVLLTDHNRNKQCKKGSPYSITECTVLGSQPAGDVSHIPGGRLPLLSARPAVTTATLKRAATNFAGWWTEARWASGLRFEPGPFCAWVQHSATEPPYKQCSRTILTPFRTLFLEQGVHHPLQQHLHSISNNKFTSTLWLQVRRHEQWSRTLTFYGETRQL